MYRRQELWYNWNVFMGSDGCGVHHGYGVTLGMEYLDPP